MLTNLNLINWLFLREEVKLRRKQQKLTQKHLAILAGVSTPSISHIETGKDVNLSTLLKVFDQLGLLEK